MTDWELMLKAAETDCSHGPGCCSYQLAVEEIFRRNAATLSPHKLAMALKAVVQHGPSKTCKVPMLVGPSNTGKSTLLYPFDDLFEPKHVFHKPALGSTFALRNIVKKKRFIFWDDYRPIEFAHKDTVPVATFLSLFIGKNTEVQVSQSFNDGNLDVDWTRGVVFTAKEDGLWDPSSKVTAEDVRHIRNRVQEFHCTEVITGLKEVESCAPCMARWIVKFSSQAIPATATSAPFPVKTADLDMFNQLKGLSGVMAAANLAGPVVHDFFVEIVAAGAVDVKELSVTDWQALSSWGKLKPFEARRLLSVVSS